MIRGALFDAAGTLIAPREPVGETYARRARECGVEADAERLQAAFHRCLERQGAPVFPGLPAAELTRRERAWWRALVEATFREAAPAAPFPDFERFFRKLYAGYARPESWRARPGAVALLAELRRRGVASAVVSNFDGRLPGILAGLGLLASLDAVILPSAAGAAKPAPEIFQLALRRLGLAASEAVFVGDDAQRDLEGARRVGIRAIDVASLAKLTDLPARLAGLADREAGGQR